MQHIPKQQKYLNFHTLCLALYKELAMKVEIYLIYI